MLAAQVQAPSQCFATRATGRDRPLLPACMGRPSPVRRLFAPCDDRIEHSINALAHILNQNAVPSLHGTLHDKEHVVCAHAHDLRVKIHFFSTEHAVARALHPAALRQGLAEGVIARNRRVTGWHHDQGLGARARLAPVDRLFTSEATTVLGAPAGRSWPRAL